MTADETLTSELRMRALLRGLEWSSQESCRNHHGADAEYVYGYCPECCEGSNYGHKAACELAACLRGDLP